MKNQSILNKIQQSANKFATMLVIFAAAMLVGCSGFVKDGAGVSDDCGGSGPSSLVSFLCNSSPLVIRETHTKFGEAINRSAINTADSTTQSSNSADRVSVESLSVNGEQLIVTVTNGNTAVWDEVSNFENAGIVVNNGVLDDNINFVQLIQPLSAGNLHIDVFASEITSTTDSDYLVSGMWVYLPLADSAELEIGAFADSVGTEPLGLFVLSQYVSGLSGNSATYSGNANGFRLQGNEPTYFQADVTLIATFGGSSGVGFLGDPQIRVEGMITGVDVPNVVLEEANVNVNSGIIGSFGDTLTAVGGYTGNWGGQFYGEAGEAIAGTFGAGRAADTDNNILADSFVGWFFGAERE